MTDKEKNIRTSQECPICFSDDVITGKYCHGCDHEFCFKCLSLWVTNHYARCPLCNGDIYGLYSQDSSVYLTPCYDNFGMSIRKNGKYTQIGNVLENGVAKQYNLKVGQFIMINNKCKYSDCSEQLQIAMKKKKMIKIDTISPVEEQLSRTCLDFFYKCRILPN